MYKEEYKGIPLSDLTKDTDMKIAENKESSSVENTLRKPGRFYDELDCKKEKEMW